MKIIVLMDTINIIAISGDEYESFIIIAYLPIKNSIPWITTTW